MNQIIECEKCKKIKEGIVEVTTYSSKEKKYSKQLLCEECYIQYKKNRKKSMLRSLTILINKLTKSKELELKSYKIIGVEVVDKIIESAMEFRKVIQNSNGVIDMELEERFEQILRKVDTGGDINER